MKSRKVAVGLSLTTVLLAVGFVLIAYQANEVSSQDTLEARRSQFDESSELTAAGLLAPYRLKYPASIPAGAELEHVAATDTRPTADELAIDDPTKVTNLAEQSPLIVGVDMYWILPNEGRLHMWQTNDPTAAAHVFLETADPGPEQDLVDITLPNGQWRRIDFYWGSELRTSLNRLFEDGVFVSVAGEVSFDTLRLVAGTVQNRQGI
jgi:hypothetical protein